MTLTNSIIYFLALNPVEY